jgi:squalene-hopene/tetraprenyl-beta-curcumene cyclase
MNKLTQGSDSANIKESVGQVNVDAAVDAALTELRESQADDGHWCFELEADATIPAEYILLNHYLGEIDDLREAKLAAYLRSTQGSHGGWPLFHDGEFNLSASVKAYFALKLTGEDENVPHMACARKAILGHGGAAQANVFTRFALALYGQLPWRAVPVMRVEAMLLPRWAPFHLNKVSYWSRTVMVPLLVLATLKPIARNPRRIDISELFAIPPDEERHYISNVSGHWPGNVMVMLDRIARTVEPLFPNIFRRRAIDRAIAFVRERLNGEDGLGGIFPAMANAVMVFDLLGLPRDDPDFVIARKAIDKLIIEKEGLAYCQPCVSPVWDTGLAVLALGEVGERGDLSLIWPACNWLQERQILDVRGDWIANRGYVRPGGWAFQYRNDYYPDVDDTAVVVMGLKRTDPEAFRENIGRAVEWIIGMQGGGGGWGAFDADNEHYFLENIPFADHGALLDPPTSDVTARCVQMLAEVGFGPDYPAIARGISFLKKEQEDDGSWVGRWGANYTYGTWSVLMALRAAGEDMSSPYVHKAVGWLLSCQRPDGGWGEDCSSYYPERRHEAKISTASQTSWALLALMAAGEVRHLAVQRGIKYLLAAPRNGGKWVEKHFNAVGFPRVFYLSYHGYSVYFPLWALARYRELRGDE